MALIRASWMGLALALAACSLLDPSTAGQSASGPTPRPVAEAVFGQPDFTSNNPFAVSASTMRTPRGVAVDGSGNLYVADTNNNRVLFFPAGSASGGTATKVFGQTDFTSKGAGTTASTMNNPSSRLVQQPRAGQSAAERLA